MRQSNRDKKKKVQLEIMNLHFEMPLKTQNLPFLNKTYRNFKNLGSKQQTNPDPFKDQAEKLTIRPKLNTFVVLCKC